MSAATVTGALPIADRIARIDALVSSLRVGTPSTASTAATTAASTAATGPSAFAAQLASATTGAGAPSGTTAATAASASGTASATPFGAEIEAAATKYGLDPALLRGLIKQESGFDPSARSGAGAVGLTQLMPATARSLGVTDATDPAQAIDGGAKYLAQQLQRFGGDTSKALAAYNAGPGAVAKFGGVPPYAETQHYVQAVLANAAAYGAGGSAATTTTPPLATPPVLSSPIAT